MVHRLGSRRIDGLETPLSKNNTHLYTTFVERNTFSVAIVFSSTPFNISFRRTLVGED
jgi:hypothetical protein